MMVSALAIDMAGEKPDASSADPTFPSSEPVAGKVASKMSTAVNSVCPSAEHPKRQESVAASTVVFTSKAVSVFAAFGSIATKIESDMSTAVSSVSPHAALLRRQELVTSSAAVPISRSVDSIATEVVSEMSTAVNFVEGTPVSGCRSPVTFSNSSVSILYQVIFHVREKRVSRPVQ